MVIGTKLGRFAPFAFAVVVVFLTTAVFHCTQSYYKDFVRGRQYFMQARYDKALAYLSSAVGSKPDSLEALRYLVWTYEKMGRKDKVTDVLEVILEVEPADLQVQRYLADSYYELGDYPSAEKGYHRLLSQARDTSVCGRLAEVLVWQKKYAQAVPLLEELVRKNQRDCKLVELLADVYSWQQQYEKAVEMYRGLLPLLSDSRRETVALKLADVLRYAGRDQEAIELYDRYVRDTKRQDVY